MLIQFVRKVSHILTKNLNKIVFLVRNVICGIMLNVLELKIKTMSLKNQIYGIALTVLSFSKLFGKEVHMYINTSEILLLLLKYFRSISKNSS